MCTSPENSSSTFCLMKSAWAAVSLRRGSGSAPGLRTTLRRPVGCFLFGGQLCPLALPVFEMEFELFDELRRGASRVAVQSPSLFVAAVLFYIHHHQHCCHRHDCRRRRRSSSSSCSSSSSSSSSSSIFYTIIFFKWTMSTMKTESDQNCDGWIQSFA